MTYFMVKMKYDNVRIIRHKRRHWYSLIGYELYTPAEYTNLLKRVPNPEVIKKYFELVNFKKTETYWLFGARFYNDMDNYLFKKAMNEHKPT